MKNSKLGTGLIIIGVFVLLAGVAAIFGHYEYSVFGAEIGPVSVTASGITPGQATVLAAGVILLGAGIYLKKK